MSMRMFETPRMETKTEQEERGRWVLTATGGLRLQEASGTSEAELWLGGV